MTAMQPLLVELGTEELPVNALPGLAQALFDGVIAALGKRGVAFDRGDAAPLYSPRRLAVLLPAVATEQPEQRSEVLGPYVSIALDADGQPTRALQGFAQKAGVDWSALERTSDAKGERFVHRSVTAGAATAALLPEILREAVDAMPIPKPMRWGDHDHAFARPVHWLVLLLGDDVVEADIFGVRADRMSRGHRFMHDKTVWIARPGDYVDALRAAKVLVDPAERRARIVEQVESAASAAGGRARIDDHNLGQVNCLVEWPHAVACSFDPAFLAVPQEALVATMETNQKFFPVLDAAGRLTQHFVGVANIEPEDTTRIRTGYERVITPRFADAKFFFDEDNKQGLEALGQSLESVTYQKKLGSLATKVFKVANLSAYLARKAGLDPAVATRAAKLSKNDLQSRLVGEFPELQGIAGRHYAALAGESAEIAAAIDEAYMPRYAGDAIAPSPLGQLMATAERLDTLAGGFAAGLQPTGNKDPFALRRNALGLARTLIEGGLDLDLLDILTQAAGQYGSAVWEGDRASDAPAALDGAEAAAAGRRAAEVADFVLDRLRGYYADQGVPSQQFDTVAQAMRSRWSTEGAAAQAVSAPSSLTDFDRRLKAIGEFARLPEADALAAANKRSRNILRKSGEAIPQAVDSALFSEDAERALASAIDAAIADTDPLLAQRDYVAVLARLAGLRPSVDAFFDQVMVNAEDAAVRRNRLALLQRLSDRLGSVAAIEHLSG
jgi:glycyl-tRNA synthetase beta chain